MATARTTRAEVIDAFGDPDRFRTQERALPPPGAAEVQVRVAAAAVNPVDLTTRAGMIIPAGAARFPMTLGWDAAGTVVAVGAAVDGWLVGDRVAVLVVQPAGQDGAYAEHVTVAADLVARVPDGVSLAQAATVPLAGLTAAQMLERAGLRAGHTLLVDAPMGGVGRFVVQLARTADITVVAVTHPRDRDDARRLGSTEVVDRGDFTAAVHQLHTQGVDAAIDLVGGATAHASLAAVRDGGTYITAVPPFLDEHGPFTPERGIRLEIQNTHPDSAVLTHLLQAIDRGELTPHIEATYPLAEAAKAHRRHAQGGLRGKLLLLP